MFFGVEHKSAPSVIRVQKLVYSYSPCNARHALLSEPFGFSELGGSEVTGLFYCPFGRLVLKPFQLVVGRHTLGAVVLAAMPHFVVLHHNVQMCVLGC